jgi:hypothetical protein
MHFQKVIIQNIPTEIVQKCQRTSVPLAGSLAFFTKPAGLFALLT